MTTLSLHRVAYDPEFACYRAEAQLLDFSGVIRRPCRWGGPLNADFPAISRGLRDAALGTR